MKKMIQFLGFLVGCLLIVVPTGANAAGHENTGGGGGYYVYFDNPRWITNPSSPGHEVVAKQYTGSWLDLGAHNCGGTYYGFTRLTTSAYRPLLSTSVTGFKFCLYQNTSASVPWTGSIWWD